MQPLAYCFALGLVIYYVVSVDSVPLNHWLSGIRGLRGRAFQFGNEGYGGRGSFLLFSVCVYALVFNVQVRGRRLGPEVLR